jgi:GTP-binding protein EngB required for normal cell division
MSLAEPVPTTSSEVPTRSTAALPDWAGPSLGDHGIGACLKRLDEGIAAAALLGLPTDEAQAVAREVVGRLGFPAETYVLALVGGTGVGKSSLLNALAGSPVSTASARRPTTAQPLAWVPRSSRPDLGGLLGWLGIPDDEVRDHDQDALGNVAILDLPDLDSVEVEHRERVEAILPRVDAVVWVTDPEKYHDAILHDDFLAKWLPRLDRQVVVLNKTDRLTADDAATVRRDLERDMALKTGRGARGALVRVLPTSVRGSDAADIEPVRAWLAEAIDAKRVVRAHVVTTIAAAVTALARAASVDPTARAKPFVDGATRRATSDRVTDEVLRVVDLPAAERQAVAATRARARARGAGPLAGITSRIYRWSGRQARVADPGAFLTRWRERGSLAPALEVLRGAVDAPLREAPPTIRASLATSMEPSSLGDNLARAVDRAIAARGKEVPSSRVWPVIGLLQTLATLTLVFAGVWVVLWVLVKFPVDSITAPVLGQLPIPLIVLVAALLAGYLIARMLGAHAGWMGRRWARVLAQDVRDRVGREVETSALAGLDRLEGARRGLWNAARGAGEECAPPRR